MKAAFLEVYSWVGTCMGASHYYGDIWYDGQTVHVTRQLTASEAVEMNKENYPCLNYQPGDDTPGFETEAGLRAAAIKTLKRQLPEATILIEGWHGCYDPRPVLFGPEDYMVRANDIVARAEIVDFWDGGRDKEMQVLADEWNSLCKEFGIEH